MTKDAIEYALRGFAVAAILTAGAMNKMEDKTPPKEITIEELVNDWKTRAEQDPMHYMEYVERFRELAEYQANPRFQIVPYEQTGGKLAYRLKIVE